MPSTSSSLYSNNAVTNLLAGISPSAVTVGLMPGAGSLFPIPSAGGTFLATLLGSAGNYEIIKVTGLTSDIATVVRAQEGTTAQTFAVGDRFELRMTAGNAANWEGKANPADLASITNTAKGTSLLGYLATFAGAVGRSLLSRLADQYTVKDAGAKGDGVTPDTTAIAAGITAVAGGELQFPAGSYIGTLPATYTATLKYQGPATPVNVYAESGETTRFSREVYRAQNTGPHAGIENSLMTFEYRPYGSGTNGPTNADYGLTISNVKQNWQTTTNPGELDGLNIIVRNGGSTGGTSDCAGILANVAIAGNSGFAAILEAVTSLYPSGGGALVRDVRVQIGVIDPVNNNYIGYFASATTGNSSIGLLIAASGTGSWDNFLRFAQVAQESFRVDGQGQIVMTEYGVPANIKTIRVKNGALSVVDTAGTSELLSLTNVGSLTISGGFSSVDYPVNPVSYTCAITSATGSFSSASVLTAYYTRKGKMVFVDIYYNIATVGTAAGSLQFVLPIPSSLIAFMTASGVTPSGKTLVGFYINSTTVAFNLYDSTTPCTITGGGHVSISYLIP